MATFVSLPVELQCRFLEYLDIDTLKRVRLVSRIAATFGAELLFHTLVLKFTEESVEKFQHVLNHAQFKLFVKKVKIDASTGNKENESHHVPLQFQYLTRKQYQIRENTSLAIDTPWSNAIQQIHQLSALRAVEMRFHEECGIEGITRPYEMDSYIQDECYRERYQTLLFHQLRKAPMVTDLAIGNLQDALTCHVDAGDISVIARLRRLALKIVTEHDHNEGTMYDLEKANVQNCFSRWLPRYWLKPPQQHLTHLMLSCDVRWGIWPFIDLREVHFPSLKSLILMRWTIVHDWQIDWVTSHGNTLEELILDGCAIIYATYMLPPDPEIPSPDFGFARTGEEIRRFERRWYDVLPVFQEDLVQLKHFSMGQSRGNNCTFESARRLPAKIHSSRYVQYVDGSGPRPWKEYFENWDLDGHEEDEPIFEEWLKVEYPQCDAEDKAALHELLNAIGVYGGAN